MKLTIDPLFTQDDMEVGSRYPIPPGWATPTQLTHILRARGIVKSMAPQQIYTGFIKKTNSEFPYDYNKDGRVIVPIEDAIKWIVKWLQSKAEKEAIKAAKAAEKAERALQAVNITETPASTEIEPEDEWTKEWNEWGDLGQ